MKPESLFVCLMLIRREKQRIRQLPVDPPPKTNPLTGAEFTDEERLIVLDEVAEEIQRELKG